MQIFATFATIWQFLVWAYLTNSPSFAHPSWPNAHPPPLPLPTLQIVPWWFLSRVLIQVFYTTKYFFRYGKYISVALQMGKGVMRRKWGNRGSSSPPCSYQHRSLSGTACTVAAVQWKCYTQRLDSFILCCISCALEWLQCFSAKGQYIIHLYAHFQNICTAVQKEAHIVIKVTLIKKYSEEKARAIDT